MFFSGILITLSHTHTKQAPPSAALQKADTGTSLSPEANPPFLTSPLMGTKGKTKKKGAEEGDQAVPFHTIL